VAAREKKVVLLTVEIAVLKKKAALGAEIRRGTETRSRFLERYSNTKAQVVRPTKSNGPNAPRSGKNTIRSPEYYGSKTGALLHYRSRGKTVEDATGREGGSGGWVRGRRPGTLRDANSIIKQVRNMDQCCHRLRCGVGGAAIGGVINLRVSEGDV